MLPIRTIGAQASNTPEARDADQAKAYAKMIKGAVRELTRRQFASKIMFEIKHWKTKIGSA